MSSKHHKWQTRWRIDWQAREAVHESGLRLPVTASGGVGDAVNAAQVQAAIAEKHGHNAPVMLQRLLREAREFVSSQVKA